MKCPHCSIAFHSSPSYVFIGEDVQGKWYVSHDLCPTCVKMIARLVRARGTSADGKGKILKLLSEEVSYLVRPKAAARPACPSEVPSSQAEDYNEACLVLQDSPKASAALGRRCLQNLLRSAANVKPGDLSGEIDQVLPNLPSYLAEAIDAIRHNGNFAAHPLKSQQTGMIVPVEPGEAEWSLDVLEQLFDFYYVQPAVLDKKRDEMNKKLQDAGKPPMK